jgi:hypothetical protein
VAVSGVKVKVKPRGVGEVRVNKGRGERGVVETRSGRDEEEWMR